MIKYRCPHCEEKLESLNVDIGKKDTCPMCGHQFTVPERSGRGRKILAVILLIGAVGGVSVGWISSRDKKSESPTIEKTPPTPPVAKAKPTPPTKAPEKDATTPIAHFSQFRPLIEDYGMTVANETKSKPGEVFVHRIGFDIHSSIIEGIISFGLNPSDQVTGIVYMFQFSTDMSKCQQLQTLNFCNVLLSRCPGWVPSTPLLTEVFAEKVVKTDKDNKDVIETVQESNGIEAGLFYGSNMPFMLNITRKTPLKEYREPVPYKPQFFGTDSNVGLWHLDWKKITKDEFSTTFSWRITVANKGKTKRSYYLTCSVQDKDGFEIEKGYADTIPIAPGEQTSVTGRVMVMGSAAKKVSNFFVTAVAH